MSELFDNENIKKVEIYDEMRKSYMDYAMSVIISRALPDVRDGLKPVHRRIVYAMYENSYFYNKPFKKSARIVGDVMAKYHPHGDTAIYDSLVRMAQSFSLRLPLIDGQGNFGSVDGDNAAAMRYTEARMSPISQTLVEDIDKATVKFVPNYDDSLEEPLVLPARYPNLLVNGSSGIAVGMATNIPTHNLGEVLDATLALCDDTTLTVNDLMQYIQGPDFPTGGKIIGRAGIIKALNTGKGQIMVAGIAEVKDLTKLRQCLIIREIPWGVNKARMIEEIAKIKDKSDYNKNLDIVSSVRDESDRHGIRVVVELKKDVDPILALNYLSTYTSFRTSFSINMLAIDNGMPKLMDVKNILLSFLDFRREVVKRRTNFLLAKDQAKAHILIGLGVAVDNIDEMISLIKASSSASVAKENMMAKSWKVSSVLSYIRLLEGHESYLVEGDFCFLTEQQAKAVLDLRLHRLTGLEREKIQNDLASLEKSINEYLDILSSYHNLMAVIKGELSEMKEKYTSPRKTQIEDSQDEIDEEDLIKKETCAVIITHSGYVKRMPISVYRTQKRGGKGKIGISTKDEDIVHKVLITDSHSSLLFFTSKGLVYKIKCYKIPEASSQSLGRAMVNLLQIDKGEFITAILPINDDLLVDDSDSLVFATASGSIRRNRLVDFSNIPQRGKIAMKLDENDSLIDVLIASVGQDILLTSSSGYCIRFPLDQLRVFSSRNSSGVRAMSLSKGSFIVNMSLLNHERIEDPDVKNQYLKYSSGIKRAEVVDTSLSKDMLEDLSKKEEFILTVTSNGYGKRTSAYEYRITNRGGKGILGGKFSHKKGSIVASFTVSFDDEIIILSNKGKVIRQNVSDIRIVSRVSVGVVLFKLGKGEEVSSVSKISSNDFQEDEEENNELFS